MNKILGRVFQRNQHWTKLECKDFLRRCEHSYHSYLDIFIEMYLEKQPPKMFYKIVVLKIFAKFTGNTCARVSFFKKRLYWKRYPGTGVFLLILQNFQEHPFYGTPPVTASIFKGTLMQIWKSLQYIGLDVKNSIPQIAHYNTYLRLRLKQKTLQLPFYLFFSFFPSRHFFWADCEKFFSQRFMMTCQETVRPRSHSFLGHSKKSFRKSCSSSCYSWRVWHMPRLMYGNQHS